MKKTILSICFLFAAVTFVSAQHAAERKAQIKQGLKEEVKLTDDQIASVMAIEDEYRPKVKAVKTDVSLSDDDKKAKSKVLAEEKRAKIEAVVGKETTPKVEAFYASLKKSGGQKTDGDEGGEKEKKDGKKANGGGDN
jgi:hypothetical protein